MTTRHEVDLQIPATLTTVRAGGHTTFDRVVFEFAGSRPGHDVRYVPQVLHDGSGLPSPCADASSSSPPCPRPRPIPTPALPPPVHFPPLPVSPRCARSPTPATSRPCSPSASAWP